MNTRSCDIMAVDENGNSLSAAASALRRIPRNQKRPWTGWLGDLHLRKGDLVIVPGGEVRMVYGAYRGHIILWKNAVPLNGGLPADVFPAAQVQQFKNPHAVLLGSLKRGRKEAPSQKKREACRLNGCKPPRSGSRPRGRPRKNLRPAVAA